MNPWPWLFAAICTMFGAQRSAGADPSAQDREAWVVSVHEARPVLLLGPTEAVLPAGRTELEDAPRLLLCAELGCAVVVSRGRASVGLRLTTEQAVAEVSPMQDGPEVLELMQASDRFWEYDQREPRPFDDDLEMGRDAHLLPPDPPPRRRRARRRARRPKREKTLLWSDPGPWTAEFGVMGGGGFTLDDARAGAGVASARLGFRYLRRSHGGGANLADSIAGGLVEAVATMIIGNHLGADLQVDVMAFPGRSPQWSLTMQPSLAVAFPRRKAVVAGRVPAMLGAFAVGVGGVGRRVGFGAQLNPRASLLVRRRFGLDLRCTLNANLATGGSFFCGLGGFVR